MGQQPQEHPAQELARGSRTTEGLTSSSRHSRRSMDKCPERPGVAGKRAYPEQMCPDQATAAPYTLPGLDHSALPAFLFLPALLQHGRPPAMVTNRASRLWGSHGRPRTTMVLMCECPSCQLLGSSCPPGLDMPLLSGLWGRASSRPLVLGAPRGAQQWEQLHQEQEHSAQGGLVLAVPRALPQREHGSLVGSRAHL